MKRAIVVSLFLAGCGDAAPAPAAAPGPASAPAAGAADGPLVAFLGDSLTAGLGLAADEAWPAVAAAALAADGLPIRVLNAGVSGDTTAGGRARVDWILAQGPDALVVALGANDGLRARPVEEIERDLAAIVDRARAAGVPTLLAGMKVPPNYGPDYAAAFEGVYARVAAAHDISWVPFLLEGVGGNPELNQADGIHPTAAGQARIAAVVLPELRILVEVARGNTPDTSAE